MTARMIENMSADAYHADPAVNWSTLSHMGRSPAHYRHALTARGTNDSAAFRLGRLVHLAVLEPETYAGRVVVWEEIRRGKAWDAFKAKHADREIAKPDEDEEAQTLSRAVRNDKHAAPYVSGGKAEASIFWRASVPASDGMPAAEIDCKSRLDYLREDGIADLKTARDASPDGFGREAWKHHYIAQAAFYADAARALTGERLPFSFVVVEKAAPHIVQVYRVPEDILELGRQEYRDRLRMLALCRSEGRWPGYFDGVTDIVPPRWAMPNDDDDVSELGLVIGGDDEAA